MESTMKLTSSNASSPNVLGVVMARAGSKGLANKHLLSLLGRPVIDYTLDHVAASRLLTRTIVSSDSSAVLEQARRRGLDTVLRPAELCTDTASVQDVMLHALRKIEGESD